ncbi:MAG: UDP-N-acetylmuramyl-tripeptide synthetase [Candidatus Doudnabacteria bacterium]|nr:UDP-N-acetylmuramyl-tripeptide synthetase [Candidatus Doudnabacteria bacterium]
MTIKKAIKKIAPKFILNIYHLSLAYLAELVYGSPSKKIIVIGVTGTNGKSTTVNLIAKILEEAGNKVALTSTVNFKISEDDKLNAMKMTMPGRFFLQKMIANAVKNNCKYMIIESSSEGILQHRQVGIHYDCMVFTNLTPEHLEAHGGFENYKKAKLTYFKHLESQPQKFINGEKISKTIIVNLDDTYADEFQKFNVDQLITFGKSKSANIVGSDFQSSEKGISFSVEDLKFNLKLKGVFDFYNSLAAIATSKAYGVELHTAKSALEKISVIPGRMEIIEAGQSFTVIVDYAYEPEEMRQVYETISKWPQKNIVQVLGPSGGGRDKARISILGEMAGEIARLVYITTDDPYDDDPKKIGEQMLAGSIKAGKKLNENVFLELDRRTAISHALRSAQPNDIVLITGKGSDQTMAVNHGYIKWDDREVVKEELTKLKK